MLRTLHLTKAATLGLKVNECVIVKEQKLECAGSAKCAKGVCLIQNLWLSLI